MNDEIYDGHPLERRPDDDAPVPTRVETVAPRAVRSRIVALDGKILDHQDAVIELLDFMPLGGEGRRLLRVLHGHLEETHKLAQGLLRAVERGG